MDKIRLNGDDIGEVGGCTFLCGHQISVCLIVTGSLRGCRIVLLQRGIRVQEHAEESFEGDFGFSYILIGF